MNEATYWGLLFVPCVFWSAYHYYKDRHRPEPILSLLLALVLGYGSAYIGLFLYDALHYVGLNFDAYELAESSKLHLLIYALVAIGPIEEFAKFLPFIVILIRTPHFDEPLDGVIYASFIALGFSFHENQQYLQYLSGSEAIARSITSPMVHVLFASIWGYAYGFADHHGINRALATACGLCIASVSHGIYDYFSISISAWTHIVPPLIILSIWVWRIRMFKIQQRLAIRQQNHKSPLDN